jgi:hypothetical protein
MDPRFNPAVTPKTIDVTIGTPGWTATVRPSVDYTNPIKTELAAAAGVDPKDCELDHWVPLAVGGHPTNRANLILQSWPVAREKDLLERAVQLAVVGRHLTLAQGRAVFTRWLPGPGTGVHALAGGEAHQVAMEILLALGGP